MPTETTTYAEWLCDPAESGQDRPLTDAEQLLFDRWYREGIERAQRLARRIVGRESADDVVHGAITRMMHKFVTDDPDAPRDYDLFRRRMLRIVYCLAHNMVDLEPYTPHPLARWGETQAPISGRKVPERLLVRDFEPVEAAMGVASPQLPSSAYRGPCGVQLDPVVMAYELEFILQYAICDLPEMQSDAILAWLEHPSRERASIELGISPKTFDTHLARGKLKLRAILLAEDCRIPDVPGKFAGPWHISAWKEFIKDLELDRQDRERMARFKAARLTPAVETRKAA